MALNFERLLLRAGKPQPKLTGDGIYYIYDYIPIKKFKKFSDEQIAITKDIWKYKDDKDDDVVETFDNVLWSAISYICDVVETDYIGLVAVPSSKVEKTSTCTKSIKHIIECNRNSKTGNSYIWGKKVYDWSNLLKRVEDVPSAHEVPPPQRPTYEDHKRTIRITNDKSLQRYRTTFIILDDVTTRGDSMRACRDILLEHGLKQNRVYCLSLSRTVH